MRWEMSGTTIPLKFLRDLFFFFLVFEICSQIPCSVWNHRSQITGKTWLSILTLELSSVSGDVASIFFGISTEEASMSTPEASTKTSSKAAKRSRIVSSKTSGVEATSKALVESTAKAGMKAASKAGIEAAPKAGIEASVAVPSESKGKSDGEVPLVRCCRPRVSCS